MLFVVRISVDPYFMLTFHWQDVCEAEVWKLVVADMQKARMPAVLRFPCPGKIMTKP